MSAMGGDESDRNAMEELLPWYAAGTLDVRDAERLERALAEDPELARRYELVREELAITVEANEALGVPSAKAIDHLFAKIAAEPVRRPPVSQTIAARLSAFLAGLSPSTLSWAATAAAVLIVVQAGTLGGIIFTQRETAPYQAATAPAAATSQPAFAIVRFDPQARAGDIARLLEADRLIIVSGPTAGGLYQLGAAQGRPSDTEIAAVIDRLQHDKSVNFVAPKK